MQYNINSQHTPPIDQTWSTKVSSINDESLNVLNLYIQAFLRYQPAVQWHVEDILASASQFQKSNFRCPLPIQWILFLTGKRYQIIALDLLSRSLQILGENRPQVDTTVEWVGVVNHVIYLFLPF